MVSSIARLQKNYDILQTKYIKLHDDFDELKEKYSLLSFNYRTLQKNIEDIVKAEVEKAIIGVKAEYDKIIKDKDLEIARLKAKLNIDATNSFPTSQTPINQKKVIPNTRVKTGKSIGGQPNHKKHILEKFRDDEITDVVKHTPNTCSCGSSNLDIKNIFTYKDELDFEVTVKKIRHDFYTAICNDCKKEVKIPIPNNLKEENQYGENVKALAITLTNETYTPMNRTRKLIAGITNDEIVLSEGYIAKLQKNASIYLEPFMTDLYTKILNQKLLHWDDTVIYINTSRACMRFYGNDMLALYKAHEHKDKDGIIEDNVLPMLTKDTIVVHDHLTLNYDPTFDYTNSECNRHLIGDLRDMYDVSKHSWTTSLINLLTSTSSLRNKYIEDGKKEFEDAVIKDIYNKFDNILEEGIKENIKNRAEFYGNNEKSLLTRIEDYKVAYLLWVIDFSVPFTNNLSERSLRSLKSKMKISGQFVNINAARNHANIRSYIETCKRANINVFSAIKSLMIGKPFTVSYIIDQYNKELEKQKQKQVTS